MNFKYQCTSCNREFPFQSSLSIHVRLLCKPLQDNPVQDHNGCPVAGSTLAIRKWDDQGRWDWHKCQVLRKSNDPKKRVTVIYFDDEPKEVLCLDEEQWGILSRPSKRTPSRVGSAADSIVRNKQEVLQSNLPKVRLAEEDLVNTMAFKYLGVMQSADGDPVVPVHHRLTIAKRSFSSL